MTMTDPIADMLSRVRNASHAHHDTVSMPTSKIKASIADILKQEGYIADYTVEDRELKLTLKYNNRERSIAGLRRVSKPGLRVYAKSTNLPKVLGGLGVAIIFLFVAWFMLITIFKPEMDRIPGGKELIDKEIAALGPWTMPQILTGIIFLGAAISWVAVPFLVGEDSNYDDAIVGIAAGLLLFAIPADAKTGVRLLDWKTANEMPWDVLLLFGGGLSLSAMFNNSGLSLWIGEMAKGLGGLPTILLIAAVALLVLFLTEITSNTATAATFLPIMGGVAVGIGLTTLIFR